MLIDLAQNNKLYYENVLTRNLIAFPLLIESILIRHISHTIASNEEIGR